MCVKSDRIQQVLRLQTETLSSGIVVLTRFEEHGRNGTCDCHVDMIAEKRARAVSISISSYQYQPRNVRTTQNSGSYVVAKSSALRPLQVSVMQSIDFNDILERAIGIEPTTFSLGS